MSIKQKQFSKLNFFTITGLVLLLILAGISTLFVLRDDSDVSADDAKTSSESAASMFSYTGTADWWQGATNETSMALFNFKTDDQSQGTDSGTCFVSAEYKMGVVDVSAELKKVEDQIAAKGNGYKMTSIGTQMLNIQTQSGQKEYELHQSSIESPATASSLDKLKGGQELGYLKLPEGYLKIIGYCDTVDELPATIPALQAIKFQKTN